MEISTFQLRAARGFLNWSQRELARKLKIASPTMNYYENGLTIPSERMEKILSIFEEQGIEFLNSPQGRSVLLRNKPNGLGD